MAKNKRDCPALGRSISGGECGAHRLSRYACPESCPYNPWSRENYDRALEIEDGLRVKTLGWMREDLERQGRLEEFYSIMRRSDLACQEFTLRHLFFERDAEGFSFARRMLRDRKDRLSNDERVMLGCLATMRPSLIEVHRVLDDAACEVVDLLAEDRAPFLLVDRSLTARVVRFTQLFGFVFETPHFLRINGRALPPPEVSGRDGDEVFREVVRHLDGPVSPPAALERWLQAHWISIFDSFEAVGLALHRRTMETLDVQWCSAVYRLENREALLRKLRKYPDVAPSDPLEEDGPDAVMLDWFDDPVESAPGQELLAFEQPKPALGRRLLGTTVLQPDGVKLEAGSEAGYRTLRERFEKRAGALATFAAERLENPKAALLAEKPIPDAALVPPALLEGARRLDISRSATLPESVRADSAEEALAELMRRSRREWLDQKIPGLKDATPRQAAVDPALRPALITMVKGIVRQHDKQRSPADDGPDEMEWMLRELGLEEMIFPAPPWREEFAEDESWWEAAVDGALPEDEVIERMELLGARYPDPGDAIDEMHRQAPELVEALEHMAKTLEANGGAVMLLSAVRAWLVLRPPGAGLVAVEESFFAGQLERRMRELNEVGAGLKGALVEVIATSPQPALTFMTVSPLIEMAFNPEEDGRGGPVLRVEDLAAITGIIMAVIDAAAR